jgi:hypothetical protein
MDLGTANAHRQTDGITLPVLLIESIWVSNFCFFVVVVGIIMRKSSWRRYNNNSESRERKRERERESGCHICLLLLLHTNPALHHAAIAVTLSSYLSLLLLTEIHPIETHCSTARVLENDESQIERAHDHLKQEFSKLFHISQLLILLLPPLFEYFQVQDTV